MNERRFAVIVASSHYQNPKLQNLQCPERDADGLNEVLTPKDLGAFTETFILKNRPHNEILLKINQTLRKAEKNDLVLIYYSGHGKLNPAGKLHLATTDTDLDALEATSIPLDTIKSYIDISPANKFVLLLDSCFSGAAGEAFAKGGVDDQLQLTSGGRGAYILTASTGIQVAKEKEGDQYSIFTKHIIDGIKSGEAANEEGYVTMDGLYHYVHDKVLEESSQEPMKWDLNVRGDLVIAGGGQFKREERAKQIRIMILDLASKNLLPDYILPTSLTIIKLKPWQLSPEERKLDELLDKFLRKDMELNTFLEEWVNLAKEPLDVKSKRQKVAENSSLGDFATQASLGDQININREIPKIRANGNDAAKNLSLKDFIIPPHSQNTVLLSIYALNIMLAFLVLNPYMERPIAYTGVAALFFVPVYINIPLGFTIAYISYRARSRAGFYFGIFYPLTVSLLFLIGLSTYDNPYMRSSWFLVTEMLAAIVATILFWFTRKSAAFSRHKVLRDE